MKVKLIKFHALQQFKISVYLKALLHYIFLYSLLRKKTIMQYPTSFELISTYISILLIIL